MQKCYVNKLKVGGMGSECGEYEMRESFRLKLFKHRKKHKKKLLREKNWNPSNMSLIFVCSDTRCLHVYFVSIQQNVIEVSFALSMLMVLRDIFFKFDFFSFCL